MAVVSKTAHPSPGEPGYLKIVKVDACGEFSIVLPSAVSRALGFNVVKGKTKEAVDQAFKKALADCQAAATRSRKVIGYSIDKSFDSSFQEGVTVNLAVQVLIEETTTVGGDERKTYQRVRGHSLPAELVRGTFDYGWPEKAHIIEHTPEREAFFRRLGEALQAVVQQINQLHDVPCALAYADGRKPFLALPGPGEPASVDNRRDA